MPKEAFWMEWKNADGEKQKLTLSVRRTRALAAWRNLRNQPQYAGATFHEPDARREGQARFKAQQAALKGALERRAKQDSTDALLADVTAFAKKWARKTSVRAATFHALIED